MAAPKRTEFEREQQLLEIQSMYLRGVRQVDIAAKFGLSQPAISRDLATIKARWKNSQLIDTNEAKQRELARVDELEKVYWQAWEKSLGERTRTKQETSADGEGDDKKKKKGRIRASVEKENLLGNPAYLAGIEYCITERAKIIGLYAPTQNNVKMDVDVTKLTEAELQAIVEA